MTYVFIDRFNSISERQYKYVILKILIYEVVNKPAICILFIYIVN